MLPPILGVPPTALPASPVPVERDERGRQVTGAAAADAWTTAHVTPPWDSPGPVRPAAQEGCDYDEPSPTGPRPQGSTPAIPQVEGEVAPAARAMDADPGVPERAAEDHAAVRGAPHPEKYDPLRRCRHGADAGARDVLPDAPAGVAVAHVALAEEPHTERCAVRRVVREERPVRHAARMRPRGAHEVSLRPHGRQSAPGALGVDAGQDLALEDRETGACLGAGGRSQTGDRGDADDQGHDKSWGDAGDPPHGLSSRGTVGVHKGEQADGSGRAPWDRPTRGADPARVAKPAGRHRQGRRRLSIQN